MLVNFSESYQELTNMHLYNVMRDLNDAFLDNTMSSLSNYIRGATYGERQIPNFRSQITDIKIFGITGIFKYVEFHVFINCDIPNEYNTRDQFLVIFRTNGYCYDKIMDDESINIMNYDDVRRCNDRINWKFDTYIHGIYMVKYFEEHSGNIIIIHARNQIINGEIICKYNNLLITDKFYVTDREKIRRIHKPPREKREKQYKYINYRTNNKFILTSITNSKIIIATFSRCIFATWINDKSKTYGKSFFSITGENMVDEFNKEIVYFFINVMHKFNNKYVTQELVELMKKIYNENEQLFTNKTNVHSMEKELCRTYFLEESNMIGNAVDILRNEYDCDSEPLPILLLRAVVYEYSLMLRRRLIQTQFSFV